MYARCESLREGGISKQHPIPRQAVVREPPPPAPAAGRGWAPGGDRNISGRFHCSAGMFYFSAFADSTNGDVQAILRSRAEWIALPSILQSRWR